MTRNSLRKRASFLTCSRFNSDSQCYNTFGPLCLQRYGLHTTRVMQISTVSGATSNSMTKEKEKELIRNTTLKMIYASPFVRTSGGKQSYNLNRYNLTKEQEIEEDKQLEDEEQAQLNELSSDDYYYLPFLYKLSLRALALEKEKERIDFFLKTRSQYVIDHKGGSWLGLPTRVDRVLNDILTHRVRSLGASGDVHASERIRNLSDAPSDVELFPYTHWRGTSTPLARLLFGGRQIKDSAKKENASNEAFALTSLNENIDFLRRTKKLYALNYYSRMYLTPKKQVVSALYCVVWNAAISLWNSIGSLICFTVQGIKPVTFQKQSSREGNNASTDEKEAPSGSFAVRALKGASKGVFYSLYHLYVGFIVSPIIHIPQGIVNTTYGFINFFTSTLYFDALSGRYQKCAVLEHYYFKRELQLQKRLLRIVGHQEFSRKRLVKEKKWQERMESMGFSVEDVQEKMRAKMQPGGAQKMKNDKSKEKKKSIQNPYETLSVPKTATTQQIKKQYKKLAMMYHPDVLGSQSEEEKKKGQHKFQEVSSAYQILSNPEKRRAYDRGGSSGVEMYENQNGTFLSGTAEQIIQGIFGGIGFKNLLIGEVYRSHWCLRMESQINVSIAEFDELQTIRVRQLVPELAAILDVHAKKPTTPYSGGSVAAPGATRVVHQVQMGGLPDPISGQRRPNATAGGKAAGRGAAGAGTLNPELKRSIMEELGEISSKARSSATKGSATGSSKDGSDASLSPYKLVPGSNPYNCFSKDFEERVDKLVDHLSKACFGPELLYEVGETYILSAQRYLNILPFYSTKLHVIKKIGGGMDRIFHAVTLKTFRQKDKDGNYLEQDVVLRKLVVEYIAMEFDTVVADFNVCLKNVIQIVCQDCGEKDKDVLKKRCYALWYIGEQMQKRGKKWKGDLDDMELIAYLQQTATSAATTARPPEF